jgi:hypothetical protein
MAATVAVGEVVLKSAAAMVVMVVVATIYHEHR